MANRPVRRPDSKGKSLHKVDGLIEILYISEENADEDPKIRTFVKDEGLRKNWEEKERGYVWKKVRLYVQSMTKGDLEVKRKEPKSNQSALPAAAIETTPAASKPAGVAEKNSR